MASTLASPPHLIPKSHSEESPVSLSLPEAAVFAEMPTDLDLLQSLFRVAEIKHRRDGTLILTHQIEGFKGGSCPHLHHEAVSSQASVAAPLASCSHLLAAVGGVLALARRRALRAFGAPTGPDATGLGSPGALEQGMARWQRRGQAQAWAPTSTLTPPTEAAPQHVATWKRYGHHRPPQAGNPLVMPFRNQRLTCPLALASCGFQALALHAGLQSISLQPFHAS